MALQTARKAKEKEQAGFPVLVDLSDTWAHHQKFRVVKVVNGQIVGQRQDREGQITIGADSIHPKDLKLIPGFKKAT